jgi:cytochrome c-type biogenesis protein CcmH/NrfF
MIKPGKLRNIVILLALAVSPLWTVRISAQSQRAKEVGTHIKCLCKGCDMSAGGCAHPGGAFSGPCDTAIAELKEIDQHLAQGQTEQQIIEAFIAKYGTIAYVEPPKHGFGLLAWLMPVIYTVVGLAIAVFVVKKWASRKPALASTATARSGASQEALARARARVAHETED